MLGAKLFRGSDGMLEGAKRENNGVGGNKLQQTCTP